MKKLHGDLELLIYCCSCGSEKRLEGRKLARFKDNGRCPDCGTLLVNWREGLREYNGKLPEEILSDRN